MRPAPGTWGSLAACALGYAIVLFAGFSGLFLAAVLASFSGIWASQRYSDITQTSDASQVVIDEFAGQWIALLPVAFLAPENWLAWAAAFGLFRLFDIVKPGPIGMLDRRIKGGLGIMVDDILAGAVAAALLYGGLFYVA